MSRLIRSGQIKSQLLRYALSWHYLAASPSLRVAIQILRSAVRRSALPLLMVIAPVVGAQPAPPYLVLTLPQGVSVQLPRNWSVISENKRITLDAWIAAKFQQISGEHSMSALGFAANYYDDKGNTAGIFNIRFYPKQTVTQSDSRAATSGDVKELDAELQISVRPGVESTGNRVLEWKGTERRSINGLTYFVSEYRRTSPQGVPFRARLIRLLDGPMSFTITVSYREDQQFFLSAITEHITQSVRR